MERKRCSTWVQYHSSTSRKAALTPQVIEQKGASAGEEQEQIKERITMQLEQANAQIKALEAQLARLGGGTF